MSPQRLLAHHYFFLTTLRHVRRQIAATALCLAVAVWGVTTAAAQEAATSPAEETTAPAVSEQQAPEASPSTPSSGADTSGEQAPTPSATDGNSAQQEAPPSSSPSGAGEGSTPTEGQSEAPAGGGDAAEQGGETAPPADQETPSSASQPAAEKSSAPAGGEGAAQPAAAEKGAAAPQAQGAAAPQDGQEGGAGSAQAEQTAKEGDSESAKALKGQEKPPEQETGLQSLGINLISNKIVLELNESYVHTTNNQLFIDGFGVIPILVVGNVSVQQIRKDMFVTTASLRYKVTDKLQAEVRLPYQYAIVRKSEPTGLAANSAVSPSQDSLGYSGGFGDVSVGVNYSLKSEGLSSPSLLAGLTFKGRNGRDIFESTDATLRPPTGSGFFSLGGSLSASKTTAPAIVFGSVGYNHAFPRYNVVFTPANKPPSLIDFEPGDNFNLSMGVAISLNYNFTLNMSYAQSVNFSSHISGRKLGNSATDAITLRIGGTWRFSTKTSVDMGVSFGVTPDAPDFRLDMRVPFKFGDG